MGSETKFKETGIGKIPEDWKKAKLCDHIEIKHGYAFKGEYFTEKENKNILLTPGNFKIGGGFNDSKFKYYTGEIPEEFILKEGDIVVTMTDLSKEGDTLGYSAKIPYKINKNFLHNQRLGKIMFKRNSNIDRNFLYWLLRNKDYRNEILATATGTTVKHTSPNRILNYSFLLPTFSEQNAIASILGALDDKIELDRQMNATLEKIGQAIFKRWFVDFEFPFDFAQGKPNEAGNPYKSSGGKMVDSELGEIPEGWRVGTLKDICEITMGQSPPGKTYNEVGEGLPFYQGIRDFGFRFPNKRVYCTIPTRFAEKGDILLSVRAPVGSLNVAEERCAIGRGIAALSPKERHYGYLYYLLCATQSRWNKFEAEGTVFGSVTKSDVHDFKIILPPEVLLDKFCSPVERLDKQILSNVKQSRNLAAIRDSLLPKLMSGKIRAKDAEM
ncbi:MAG TPA: restriction endonuclease subunit S [Candidatus Brocadiia bacterium]|nr:restriction endonuclease subunit S [Candidatus Brocadiales bacterium]